MLMVRRGPELMEFVADSESTPERMALPPAYREQRWYAVYTSANREKSLAEQLALRNLEHFLPVYASLRRWKDRRVTLELPLFRGYLFVRIALKDRLLVTQLPGAVRLVGFDGAPAALPDEQIAALRMCVDPERRAEPHDYLKFIVGRRVRVLRGPLRGLEGSLLRIKKSSRFVFSLQLLKRSISIEMDPTDVEPLDRVC